MWAAGRCRIEQRQVEDVQGGPLVGHGGSSRAVRGDGMENTVWVVRVKEWRVQPGSCVRAARQGRSHSSVESRSSRGQLSGLILKCLKSEVF